MFRRFRALGSVPVFPAVLGIGALLLGLPWLRILLLGLLAACATGVCALLLAPRTEEEGSAAMQRPLRRLRRTVEGIRNPTVARRGQEILADLKQCRNGLALLPSSAKEEITEYFLPTFLKYFTAYATFEECNGGDASVLATMEQMEGSLEEIAENFRKLCDRNDRRAALDLKAEQALLRKKLNPEGFDGV